MKDTKIEWKLLRFEELSGSLLYDLLKEREAVFVVEQECAYQEVDGLDVDCLHLIGMEQDRIAAYARLIPSGVCYDQISIGRILVPIKDRGNGWGHELMKKSLEEIESQWPDQAIKIMAQCYLEEFYEGYGFKTISEPFLDYGIEHVYMIR